MLIHRRIPRDLRSSNAFQESADQAFTLIELLTVIAIVAILAGILIPTIGRVRRNAQESQSISNARQLVSTMLVYANDNQGKLPPISGESPYYIWTDFIFPYTELTWGEYYMFNGERPNGIFEDPANDAVVSGGARSHFGANDNIIRYGYTDGLPMVKVVNPARTLAIMDSAQPDGEYCSRGVNSWNPDYHAFPHSGKATMVFLDGHAESRTAEELPLDAYDYPWAYDPSL
jgi:general secretion pathway protein G